MWVGLEVDGDTAGTDFLTGLTYNSVAMTLADKQQHGASGSPIFALGWVYLYYLDNPSVGTFNVVASFSGATSGAIRGSSTSYTGTKSGTPDATFKAQASGGSDLVLALTTIADNCWVIAVTGGYQNFSVGTNLTTRNSNGLRQFFADSNAVITPAGSFSSTTAGVGNNYPGGVMASFAPQTTSIKTVNGLAYASVKTVDGLEIASVKTINGLQ